jgi:hypothetical protein
VSDIVERLRSRGCPIRGLSQDGEECGNLHKAAAAEIEQLRKLEKDHQAILDTACSVGSCARPARSFLDMTQFGVGGLW